MIAQAALGAVEVVLAAGIGWITGYTVTRRVALWMGFEERP